MLAGEQTPQRPFVTVGRNRQEAADRTDCCSRAITVRDGKLTNIREYIDTQALARASQMDAFGPA